MLGRGNLKKINVNVMWLVYASMSVCVWCVYLILFIVLYGIYIVGCGYCCCTVLWFRSGRDLTSGSYLERGHKFEIIKFGHLGVVVENFPH